MHLLDQSLDSPAANLAADEALLDAGEEGRISQPLLRFWESPVHFVVVGYSNQVALEVNETACAAANVPVLRRCSGGGTVLQGPGCLNFALVLPIPPEGPLAHVTATNTHVMERHAAALGQLLGPGCVTRGTSDLALGHRKFSGNAQRRRRRWLLFHGTLLYNFDLALISRLLPMPSRQPDYRLDRSHDEFVTNIPLAPAAIKAALAAAWLADAPAPPLPTDQIAHLVAHRYSTAEWNRKF